MRLTLTLDAPPVRRWLSFIFGLGMAVSAFLTIQHFFLANYPESIFEGSFCDISAFFNCDSSAFTAIARVFGIPIGLFGFIIGALVMMGVLFPSEKLERTNGFISVINLIVVAALLIYSVLFLKSLCLLCTGYYIFSILNFSLFWKYGIGRREMGCFGRFFRPSFKMVVTFAAITAVLSLGMREYHDARKAGQSGIGTKIVRQFFDLPVVGNPSFISPYWTARSTDIFEEAPVHIVAYSDFTCPDCLFLNNQLTILKQEFAGQINIAFQFFPLEGLCNTVVSKDIHPGACDLSYIAAADPAQFLAIHDEIFFNFNRARTDAEWREDLARRHGIDQAYKDSYTQDLVKSIIETGREYEKTADRYEHGIRSTPTLIINGRMIIGTLPDEQIRAICQALIERSGEDSRFIENWVPPKKRDRVKKKTE